MGRNRKNQNGVVRFGPVLRALSLCVFLGGSGVGYVWQKDQINRLGDDLRRSERHYEQVRGQNERLARVLAGLQSPVEIEARVKKSELGLVAPQPDQIVRLMEMPIGKGTATGGVTRLYAATPAER